MRFEAFQVGRSIALIPILIGCVVMFGWWAHNTSLIQLRADLVPMQFNTALAAFLAGLCGFCGHFKRIVFARAAATAGFILAFLTFIQYPLDTNFGIDAIFIEPYITVASPDLGRMAINTSLGFCLIFIAAGMIFYRPVAAQSPSVLLLITVLLSVTSALALVSLFGYLTGLVPAFGWGNMSQMAPHTALSLLSAGISLLILNKIQIDHFKLFQRWLITLSVALFITLATCLYFALLVEQEQVAARDDRSDRQLLAQFVQQPLLAKAEQLLAISAALTKSDDQPELESILSFGALLAGETLLVQYGEGRLRPQVRQRAANAVTVAALDACLATLAAHGQADVTLCGEQKNQPSFLLTAVPVLLGGQSTWLVNVAPWYGLANLVNEALDERRLQLQLTFIEPQIQPVGALAANLNFRVDFVEKARGTIALSPVTMTLFVLLVFLLMLLAAIVYQLILMANQKLLMSDMHKLKVSAFNTMLDGLVIISQTGQIQDVNDAGLKMFDYTKAELLGKNVSMLMPEPYRSEHDGYIGNYEKTGQARVIGHRRILQALRKNRQVFPVQLQVTQGHRDGKVIYVGVIHDLTEKLLVEQEAAKKQELLSAAMRASSSGYIIFAKNGAILEFNHFVMHWLELDAKSMVNRSFYDFLTPEYREDIRTRVAAMVSAKSESIQTDVVFGDTEEQYQWAMLSIARVQTQELGGEILFVANIVSIEEQKNMTQALESKNRVLLALNAELDQFAYIASHDLKSPLRGIRQLAAWISEDLGKVPEAVQEHIDLMNGRILRMENLLSDLLAYSRIGRDQSKSKTFDLQLCVTDIFALLEKPEAFHCYLETDLTLLTVNQTAFEQVIRNLVENSIKHRQADDGYVRVTILEREDDYRMVVEDNGPGISEAFKSTVFDMFQTLRPRDEVEGSGMGLAIAKKVVEGFGGAIVLVTNEELVSEQGVNCRFIVTWPKTDIYTSSDGA